MTIEECVSRDQRLVENIRFVFQANPRLHNYAAALQVSIENASVVLRGELPRADLKDLLIPAIRQAGVLYRVTDCVRIGGRAVGQ